MKITVEVVETVHRRSLYTVEADNYLDALEKLESGDTHLEVKQSESVHEREVPAESRAKIQNQLAKTLYHTCKP
jgi:hypothetical protein